MYNYLSLSLSHLCLCPSSILIRNFLHIKPIFSSFTFRETKAAAFQSDIQVYRGRRPRPLVVAPRLRELAAVCCTSTSTLQVPFCQLSTSLALMVSPPPAAAGPSPSLSLAARLESESDAKEGRDQSWDERGTKRLWNGKEVQE